MGSNSFDQKTFGQMTFRQLSHQLLILAGTQLLKKTQKIYLYSVGQMSVGQIYVGQMSASQMSLSQTSVGQMCIICWSNDFW